MKEKKMEIIKGGKKLCSWMYTEQVMQTRDIGVWKHAGFGLRANTESELWGI